VVSRGERLLERLSFAEQRLRVDVKIVDATATPIAPPICCTVFSSPDARPARFEWTPTNAAIVTGMNVKAIPSENVRYAGSRSGQ